MNSILICLEDHQNETHFWKLIKQNLTFRQLKKRPRPVEQGGDGSGDDGGHKRLLHCRLLLCIDGITLHYALQELRHFSEYKRYLSTHPAFRNSDLLWLRMVPVAREVIDYKWNKMVSYSLRLHIEVDYLMSWLSTLGGGFSALGEQFAKCAKTAGKISMRQLYIGMRLGDPFLQARCKLYYSLSLIQTGRLRQAKDVILEQYEFARRQKEFDGKLVNMCKGIWHRLQYEYGLRAKSRQLQRQTK